MTMKITIEELIGSDEPVKPSEENIEFKEQLEKEVEKYRKDKTVPTNEERREVARNLREPFDVVGQGRYVALNGTLFGMQLLANDEQTLRNGVKHIADLIEPEPERTCHFEPDVIEVLLDEDGNEILDADGNEIETGEPAEDCSAFECSECGYPMIFDPDIGWFDYWSPYKPHFKYCPNCGAKVVE